MKKIFCIMLAISICSLFAACGNTSISSITSLGSVNEADLFEGVPDSLVLRNVSIDANMTYIINHNYDIETHIDDVELIISCEGEYGVKTQTYVYAYQYDQNSDLWSLIGNNNGLQSDIVNLNAESFINREFSGRFTQAHSGQYFIDVRNLDLANKEITLDYLIVFDDGEVLSAVETVGIYNCDAGLGFAIEYKRSMVVRFDIIFLLDLDEGICT